MKKIFLTLIEYNLLFTIAVSYTHLDVYKRQPVTWDMYLNVFNMLLNLKLYIF